MKNDFPSVVGIVISSLLLRFGYVLWLGMSGGIHQFSDFQYLFDLAGSLAAGDGFTLDGVRVWNQSLGYPLFLAPCLALFGAHIAVVMAVNVLLGGAAVGLVYLLARLLFPDRRAAVFAGILAAVYPDLLLYTGLCASENLLIPLTLGMVCVAVYPWRKGWQGGALCGLLAALAATTKAHVLFLVPALPLFWLVSRRQWVVASASAAVVGVVVLLPWTLHNYRLSGHFVPFAAVAGETFLDGNNPVACGVPSGLTTLPDIEATGLHPVEKDRLKMRYALNFIRNHPGAYVKLLGLKLVRAALPVRDFVFEAGGRNRFFSRAISRGVPTFFNLVLYIGILLALWKGLPSRRHEEISGFIPHTASIPSTWWFTLLVAGAMLLMQLVFFAYSRYRLPFLCVLLPAVAYGWSGIRPVASVVEPRAENEYKCGDEEHD